VSKGPRQKPEDEAWREVAQVFGANLQAARARKGMTQEDLASVSGTGRTYLSLIEAGQQNLTLSTAVSLAKAVDSTLIDLLKSTGDLLGKQEPATTISGPLPVQVGTLAIELPAGQAFEIAIEASKKLGRGVPLIEPETRQVRGFVQKP
jgi:transcriptional regulator with XRE-family HTH domain